MMIFVKSALTLTTYIDMFLRLSWYYYIIIYGWLDGTVASDPAY